MTRRANIFWVALRLLWWVLRLPLLPFRGLLFLRRAHRCLPGFLSDGPTILVAFLASGYFRGLVGVDRYWVNGLWVLRADFHRWAHFLRQQPGLFEGMTFLVDFFTVACLSVLIALWFVRHPKFLFSVVCHCIGIQMTRRFAVLGLAVVVSTPVALAFTLCWENLASLLALAHFAVGLMLLRISFGRQSRQFAERYGQVQTSLAGGFMLGLPDQSAPHASGTGGHHDQPLHDPATADALPHS
jgi:hypothetical protein